MSESTSSGDSGRSVRGWDSDPTDSRKDGDWKSIYPTEARKGIRWETLYLVMLFAICVYGVFSIIYKTLAASEPCCLFTKNGEGTNVGYCLFLGYVSAWIAGTLGGCSYSIKWMYHIVAKRRWHEDRRLWRLLSPHLSGVIALIMVFLVSSGLLQLFDKDFLQHPSSVMAFSFLVGYFSDNALAKMADVADTLFGGVKKDK